MMNYIIGKAKLIKHILVRHEQSAVHAADAYARTTNKVGVCFATSDLAQQTGNWDCKRSYGFNPLVVITGQVGRSRYRRFSRN